MWPTTGPMNSFEQWRRSTDATTAQDTAVIQGLIPTYVIMAADVQIATRAAAAQIIATAANERARIEAESTALGNAQLVRECESMRQRTGDVPALCAGLVPEADTPASSPAIVTHAQPSNARAALYTIGTGIVTSLGVVLLRKAFAL